VKVAVLPTSRAEFDNAVISGGGQLASLGGDVEALIWTDYARPELLRETLDSNPQLKWVQLPFAGVDAFADVIARAPMFTSAKGAYSEPVAEHVLALCLALGRAIPERVRATSWGKKFAVSLYESRILVIGAGGIAREFERLIAPFRCPVITLGSNEIHRLAEELPKADFVVLACALTEKTKGLINKYTFSLMKSSAFLVNVARGPIVVTSDLIDALEKGQLAGAALDVTDPEPLPEGHPLWRARNILITPHTADTDAQVIRMFAARIEANVRAFCADGEWIGVVDKKLGY
jgi:phosphoglycerate dehydrogenase-like enzyme